MANIDWARAIAQASVKLNVGVGKLTRFLALQIFRGVILKTPVDIGHLRAAWAISWGDAPDVVREPGQQGNKVLPDSAGQGFPTIWITNGLPYAAVVEYGLWPGVGPLTQTGANPTTGPGVFSRQAPAGMVELTLLELESTVIAAMDKL